MISSNTNSRKFLNLKSIVAYIKEAYKDQGLSIFYNTIAHTLYFLYHKKLRQNAQNHTFVFRGRVFPYFYSFYHATYANERAIEIPIMMGIVEENLAKRILEVGNVLSHYFDFEHTIVDKYEVGEGVINEDVAEFRTGTKYDLIVSISTLEHVGWDEVPRDNSKIFRAVSVLKSLLSAEGMMIISVPVGQNPGT